MCCMMMHAMHSEHDAHQRSGNNENQSLLEILKRRYAIGEINREQFEEMKRVVGETSQNPIESSSLEHHGH